MRASRPLLSFPTSSRLPIPCNPSSLPPPISPPPSTLSSLHLIVQAIWKYSILNYKFYEVLWRYARLILIWMALYWHICFYTFTDWICKICARSVRDIFSSVQSSPYLWVTSTETANPGLNTQKKSIKRFKWSNVTGDGTFLPATSIFKLVFLRFFNKMAKLLLLWRSKQMAGSTTCCGQQIPQGACVKFGLVQAQPAQSFPWKLGSVQFREKYKHDLKYLARLFPRNGIGSRCLRSKRNRRPEYWGSFEIWMF